MPTILRENGYRFFFFSNEHLPKHIHVEKSEKYLKVEIETLAILDSFKMTTKEQKEVVVIVEKHQKLLLEAWNEYFDRKN
jgi:hypothetical protein